MSTDAAVKQAEAPKNEDEKSKQCPQLWKPGYIEFLPCYHRWQRFEGVSPYDPLCPVHWEMGPSERTYDLSMPLKRNMIWLWINFARTMEPKRREGLKKLLIDYYKFDPCDLDRMLASVEEQEKRRRLLENAGPFDVVKVQEEAKDSSGGDGGGGGGDADENDKKAKKDKKKKKKGKGGHQALGNVQGAINQALSTPTDELFISRAPEYFDVQATLILNMVCKLLDMNAPHPTRPSKSGAALALACLNLTVWIAKNIVAPASQIHDDKIEEYLALRGKTPKKKGKKGGKGKKSKKKKGKKSKKSKKGKKKKKKVEKKEDDEFVPPEIEKTWGFKQYPCKIPQKSRLVRHEEDPVEILRLSLISTHSDIDTEKCNPMSAKELFVETYMWYNPEKPEFMYDGKRHFPESLLNFEERHGIEKRWSLKGVPTGNQNLIPEHVPPYYPHLRPLRLCAFATQGSPPQPWYIMSTPFTYEEIQSDFYYWECPEMIEQFEILSEMYDVMTNTPKLSIDFQVEMLRNFKEAVDCAKRDLEDVPGYVKVIHDKYQIIIERLLMDSIGPGLQNYNEETPDLVRTLCSQAALYINLLFAQTARELWDIQSSGTQTPSTASPQPEPTDDPDMTHAWNSWLKWLMELAEVAEGWSGWLAEEAESARQGIPHDSIEDIKEKADVYCSSVCDLLTDANVMLERSESLESLKHRKFKTALHDTTWHVNENVPAVISAESLSIMSIVE